MALAGVASAADSRPYSIYSDELKNGLVFAYSFDSSAQADSITSTVVVDGSFTRNETTGIGSCAGSSDVVLTNLGITEDFTFSFKFVDASGDLNPSYKGCAFVTLYSDASSSDKNDCFYFSNNGRDNFGLAGLAWGDTPAGNNNWIYDNQISTNNAKGSVFTLTWDSSAKSGVLYKDGASIKSFTDGAGTLEMITFASANGTYNTATVSYDNIALWNRALSAGEVASLSTLTIPEPTTATLSLLALAGLAARRRRK